MKSTLIRLALIFIFSLSFFLSGFISSGVSYAQESEKQGILNKLLAPGPLIEGHKNLETKDCLSCHETGSGVPDNKCLECHKEIQKSVHKKKTFHGMNSKRCFECHSDHKGRKFNSIKVDESSFDHEKTGFSLKGKHSKIKCSECHKSKRGSKSVDPGGTRFFGKGSVTSCKSCHKGDDVHYFKGKWAKRDCSSCHGEISWKRDLKFQHDKDTEFTIKGAHRKLKCAECHAPKGKNSVKYNWKELRQKQCLSCHSDIHGKRVSKKFQGGKCKTCHTENRWKISKFNHSITGFKLNGKHSKAKCTDCHKQKSGIKNSHKNWVGLKKQCISCHTDIHGYAGKMSKRFGSLVNCQKCHSEKSWKENIDFNHSLDTRFSVDGKHSKLKCSECHVPLSNQKQNPSRKYHWDKLSSKTCENCHKSPHKDVRTKVFKLKKCSECHVTSGWRNFRKTGKGFSHDLTRFKLTGKHKKISCDDCHKSGKSKIFKFEGAEKKFCVSCHNNVHKNQFSEKFSSKSCAECHNSTTFTKRLNFDHGKTRFKLTGAHLSIQKKCSECHIRTEKLLTKKPRRLAGKFIFKNDDKKFCVDCHQNVHKNQFSDEFSSKSCTECHSTKSFYRLNSFDHTETGFGIKGKHKKLKCSECHVRTKSWHPKRKRRKRKRKSKFIFHNLKSKDCAACHKDTHKGSNGPNCSDCHTEKGWKLTSDFHKNFKLKGVHYMLQCSECHIDKKRLTGMGDNCQLCHQKDDIHQGTLPDCNECHRQSFWEVTSFKHSMSSFPLKGAHRVLDCASCHSGGIYDGTPSNCSDCHLSDALGVGSPNHSLFGNINSCSECHKNTFTFSGAN